MKDHIMGYASTIETAIEGTKATNEPSRKQPTQVPGLHGNPTPHRVYQVCGFSTFRRWKKLKGPAPLLWWGIRVM